MKSEYQSRRSFLARTVELAAAVPLVGLILENFRNRTSYYEIDCSHAQMLESSHPTLDEITRFTAPLGNSLNNLDSNYKSAYHKSHIRMVPQTTTVGKTTVTRMLPLTYYTWEEPSNVPKHDVIDGWNNFQADFSNKINGLYHGATIDLEKLRELAVLRQTTGEGREGLVSLAIYTPQIAALLFYEEAIAKIRHGHENHASAEELVDRHDTRPQITRRSFFKVGVALAGAFVALPIVYHNRQKRQEGKVKLEEEIDRMRVLGEISGDEAFAKYFGVSPKQLIEQYRGQLRLSQTLQKDVRNEGVRTSFSDFVEIGSKSIDSLENLFSDGVPKDLSDTIKSTLIAQNLRDKSVSEPRAIYTGLGLTGLVVAGTIAATLIPLELANEYFANKVKKNKGSL